MTSLYLHLSEARSARLRQPLPICTILYGIVLIVFIRTLLRISIRVSDIHLPSMAAAGSLIEALKSSAAGTYTLAYTNSSWVRKHKIV